VWYVPFLVKHLGPAAYGLIPLASTITSFMALITVGLNAAVGRSLTIALEQENHEQANRIFNTSFWGGLTLCGGLLLPASLGLVFLDSIIRVPPGFESQARWLFAAVVAAFLLTELKLPFIASAYCRNRFDLYNLVTTAEVLTRVGLVVVLFYALSASIQYVGCAILCGTLVSAVGSIWLWRRLTPSLRIALRDFDWAVLKTLTTTGGPGLYVPYRNGLHAREGLDSFGIELRKHPGGLLLGLPLCIAKLAVRAIHLRFSNHPSTDKLAKLLEFAGWHGPTSWLPARCVVWAERRDSECRIPHDAASDFQRPCRRGTVLRCGRRV
jgi:hypothetical protein